MRILPFPIRHKSKVEGTSSDWGQQEIADFYRAHNLLVQNGANIGIDRGLSDIGDPWMVFFDNASQDVFLHVARISGECILVCDTLRLRLSAADIGSLIATFEQSVRHYLSIMSERPKNVVVHPAARIIMSISAIFLLFKLESGEAHAKDLATKAAASNDVVSWPIDSRSDSAFARAQATFARVFDSVTTPSNAALLAGIILTSEFALPSEVFHVNAAADAKAVDTLPVADRSTIVPLDMSEQSLHEHRIREVEVVSGVKQEQHKDEIGHDALSKAVPVEEAFNFDLPKAEAPLPVVTSKVMPIVISMDDLKISPPNIKLDGDSASASDSAKLTDAIKVLETILGIKIHASQPAPAPPPALDGATQPTHLTAANLDSMDSKVGFFMQTHYSERDLYALVQHFSKAMGQFDYDYVSGKVLIEEKNLAALPGHDIGIWTNVMSDGSTFSVAGHVNLIDDVATFFT